MIGIYKRHSGLPVYRSRRRGGAVGGVVGLAVRVRKTVGGSRGTRRKFKGGGGEASWRDGEDSWRLPWDTVKIKWGGEDSWRFPWDGAKIKWGRRSQLAGRRSQLAAENPKKI